MSSDVVLKAIRTGVEPSKIELKEMLARYATLKLHRRLRHKEASRLTPKGLLKQFNCGDLYDQ